MSSLFTINQAALKITILYLALGVLWITFSDRLVASLFGNSSTAILIQTTKGIGYVIVTSILLFALIRYYFNKNEQIHDKLLDEKKRRIDTLINSRKILESFTDAFFSIDGDFRLTYVNNEATKMLGRKEGNLIGKNLWEEFPEGKKTKLFPALLDAKQNHQNQYFEEYYKAQSSWFDVRVFPTDVGASVFFLNINQRKKHEEDLEYLVQYDFMTGLRNRFSLTKDAEHLLMTAEKNDTKVALIVIDLNRFKTVNDTFGHHIGDELLKQVGKRLKLLSEKMQISVYRNGADEFSILYGNMTSFAKLHEVLEFTNKELSKPYFLDGQHIVVDVSIGISIFPEDSRDLHTLFQHADIAMYLAKEEAGNSIEFYLKERHQTIDSFKLEHDLKRGLQNQEFYLQYQPRYDLKKDKIVAVEALIRWNHPKKGRIPPLDFIPIAEETGYIIPLGEWIIQESFAQLKKWENDGLDLEMSINLSANQIRKSTFVEEVSLLIEKFNVTPKKIEFEITETVLMYHIETSLDTINGLKKLGCRIALDDFGTGYSSLNYLKIIPADFVKIDRSFMNDIPVNKVNTAIVETIIHLTRKLGMYVIAEGIENKDVIPFLKRHECDGIQGFIISKPVDGNDIPIIMQDPILIS
ncbi:sensor domain-containing protein [Salipaludibacillus daqingensis]|uniref:sensor domain-containing protein n=1 Tax=Salipaludibacillus daqingensis TaxID=3041001 RepID=UPI002473A22D|nr:EAL domain-containing protein [Salipaludibacillus daqingensis]